MKVLPVRQVLSRPIELTPGGSFEPDTVGAQRARRERIRRKSAWFRAEIVNIEDWSRRFERLRIGGGK